MTTTVTVEAHCGKDTEVMIVRFDGKEQPMLNVIQNGEQWSGYVYNNYEIIVKEVEK
jgi:hypothetical protein